jgi:hypothetical protein
MILPMFTMFTVTGIGRFEVSLARVSLARVAAVVVAAALCVAGGSVRAESAAGVVRAKVGAGGSVLVGLPFHPSRYEQDPSQGSAPRGEEMRVGGNAGRHGPHESLSFLSLLSHVENVSPHPYSAHTPIP